MKYVNRLTDEQIKEILSYVYNINSKFQIVKYSIKNDCLKIKINNMYDDRFDLEDYYLLPYDFYDYEEYDNKIKYRKKMLEYFGEPYAIDYLLEE